MNPPKKRRRSDAPPSKPYLSGTGRPTPRRRRTGHSAPQLPTDASAVEAEAAELTDAAEPDADEPEVALAREPQEGPRERFSADFRPGEDPPPSSRPLAFEEVDEFGYDPAYERKVMPLLDLLYEKYFRVEVHGMERVPSEGRCLLVANHSGTLPIDGLMMRMAVRREHARRRDVRWLAEDGLFHFPFIGNMTNRIGAVRACQENAERLLEHESLVVVFPEGKKGIGKLFRDRYRLQRFGRGGFVKLGLRTGTPIIPVAIVGGEETNPMLGRIEYLTKALGIPYLPITPTFPLLGPAGLLPAPTKWKIFFGEPIALDDYAPAAADDDILVGRLTERVRAAIQAMLDQAVAARRSVWFG
jgi:1-acyl-sn-glycerol-3-phosphate acyltransferase